jgi:hypothetical protein
VHYDWLTQYQSVVLLLLLLLLFLLLLLLCAAWNSLVLVAQLGMLPQDTSDLFDPPVQ